MHRESRSEPLRDAAGGVLLGSLMPGVSVVAASPADMLERLTSPDEFVRRQSLFDRQSRLSLAASEVDVTESMYLSYVGAQVVAWTEQETSVLSQIVATLATQLASFPVSLPATIALVKTTGKEEGFAAYTRHLDTIVVPANMVGSISARADFGDPLHPSGSSQYLAEIVTHELFHLVSKNNPTLRRRLYARLGFRSFEPIPVPSVPWPAGGTTTMDELAITNPDAPHVDVAIELDVPAPDGSTVRRWLAPVLLADGPYDRGGQFFDYLGVWMMEVEGADTAWAPRLDGSGQPVMHRFELVEAQYLDVVGRNFTNEVFHPDEILAQSFVSIVRQPSLSLLDDLRTLLTRAV